MTLRRRASDGTTPHARTTAETPATRGPGTGGLRITWRIAVYLAMVGLAVPFLRTAERPSHAPVLATMTAAILQRIGVPATSASDVVSGPRFAMQVAPVCDGADLALLLGLAILLSPVSRAMRAGGILSMLLLTQALNLVRLVVMFVVGTYYPADFEFFHHVLWQAIAIIFCVAFYAAWLARTAGSRRA